MLRHLPLLSLPLAGAALVVALAGPERGDPAPAAPAPEAASREDLAALQGRIRTLEGDADLLRARIRALESRPASAAGGAEATAGSRPGAPAPGQAEDVLRELIDEDGPAAEGARSQLKEMVRSVQDELREEQRRERFERLRENERKAAAESHARWRQFVAQQQLDYRQEQTLMTRLETERTRREQLFEEVRNGTKTTRDMRTELRSLRTTTDQEMKAVLSETQHQSFLSERRRDQRRPGAGSREGGRDGGQRTRQR